MGRLDAEATADLNAALSAQSRSLVQYTREMQGGLQLDKTVYDRLYALAAEEQACRAKLGGFIESRGQVPLVGPYRPDLARFNYCNHHFYLNQVLQDKRDLAAFLQEKASRHTGTETGRVLSETAAVNTAHVESLQALVEQAKTIQSPRM